MRLYIVSYTIKSAQCRWKSRKLINAFSESEAASLTIQSLARSGLTWNGEREASEISFGIKYTVDDIEVAPDDCVPYVDTMLYKA